MRKVSVLAVVLLLGSADLNAFAEDVEVLGVVVPARKVTLMAPLDGILDRLDLKVGDQVRKGTTLLHIQRREAELQVEAKTAILIGQKQDHEATLQEFKAKRQLLQVAMESQQLAENDLKRVEALVKLAAASETELARARSRLQEAQLQVVQDRSRIEAAESRVKALEARSRLAEIELELAKHHLEQHVVKAPFDAVVLAVHKQSFEAVERFRTPLLTLVTNSPLVIEAAIPLNQLQQVEDGVGAMVKFENVPNPVAFEAKVSFIAPIVEKDGTCRIRVSTSRGDDPYIRIGTPAKIKIRVEQ